MKVQNVSFDEIYDKLENVKGKKLIIADSCYSGNFYKDSAYSTKINEFNFTKAFNNELIKPKGVKKKKKKKLLNRKRK